MQVNSLLITMRIEDGLITIQQRTKYSQSAAYEEGNHKTGRKIKDDVLLVGLACLAIVLIAAILAFDMGKQGRAKRASPPCIADFLRVTLSAIGTGGILNWGFHKFSSITK